MGGFLHTNVVLCFLVIAVQVLLDAEASSSTACDLNIDNTLRTLLSQDKASLQVRSLRRELLKKILEEIERDMKDESRQQTNFPTSNNLPYEMKRNLESLARAGYIKTLPDDDENDLGAKRNIASLVRNGDLPYMFSEKEKKGIESLARNGDLHPRSDIRKLLNDLYMKRNVASLARDYNFPSYGKKSVSSLAKSGELPYLRNQRNTDAVKRDVPNYDERMSKQNPAEDKRNLQSIKAHSKQNSKRSAKENSSGRNKREADYFYTNEEFPSSDFQTQSVYDYDDLLQELNDADIEKRFLGSVAKSGWFQPASRYSQYASPEKRHIGALARLGWLPGFRHIRRFNRSGRSTISDDTCREVASDGEVQTNSDTKDSTLSVNERGKDYGRPPANFLLRTLFFHPRSH